MGIDGVSLNLGWGRVRSDWKREEDLGWGREEKGNEVLESSEVGLEGKALDFGSSSSPSSSEEA